MFIRVISLFTLPVKYLLYWYVRLFKHLLFSAIEFILVIAGWKTLDEGLEEFEDYMNRKDAFFDLYFGLIKDNIENMRGRL